MAKIEERILTMKFDNAQFRKGAQEVNQSLAEMKRNMNFKGVGNAIGEATKPIKGLEKAISSNKIASSLDQTAKSANSSFSKIQSDAAKVNLNPIVQSVDEVKASFTTLGAISAGALATIGGTAVTKLASGIRNTIKKVISPVVDGGMRRAQNLEQANFMMSGVIDSAEEVELVMENAKKAVDGTAYGLDQAAKAAAQFAASGIKGGDGMMTALRGISGVAAMTNSEFDDIANIFTTVNGNGKLMTEQLNQIASRGINAASALAKHFNVTEGELREMVSKGKVGFAEFAEAMNDAFGDQAGRANETFSGARSNLMSAFGRIGADVATVYLEKMRDLFNSIRPAVNALHKVLAPLIELINNQLRGSIDFLVRIFDRLTAAMSEFNAEGGEQTARWAGVIKFLRDIGTVASVVSAVFGDMVKVMLGGTPKFFEMSDTASEAGTKIQHIFRKLLSVIMLVPQIIGMVVKAFLGVGNSVGSVGMSFLDVVDKIASFLYITAEAIRASKVLEGIATVLGAALRFSFGVVAWGAKIVAAFFGLLAGWLPSLEQIVGWITKAREAIVGFFTGFAEAKMPKFSGFAKEFLDWLKGIGKALKTFDIQELWSAITKLKLPKLNLGQFESLSKVLRTMGDAFSKIKDGLAKIDWSPITGMFKNFELPDMGQLKGLGSSVGGALKSGVGALDGDAFRDFGTTIKTRVSEGITYLRNVDYEGIWARIKSAFTNGAKAVGSAMADFGRWIKENISKVDWKAVGTTLVEGITSAVKMIVSTAGTVTETVTEFFKNAIDNISWSSILDGLKDFGNGIKDAVKDLFNFGDDVDVEAPDVSAVTDAVDTVRAATSDAATSTTIKVNPIINWLQEARAAIGAFFAQFKDGDFSSPIMDKIFGTDGGAAVSSFTEYLKAGWEKITGSFENIGNIGKFVKNPIKTLFANAGSDTKEGFANITESIGTGFIEIATKFGEGFANVTEKFDPTTMTAFLNGFGVALGGAGVMQAGAGIRAFGNSFKDFGEAVAKVPTSFAGVLDQIKENIAGFHQIAMMEARSNAILKLAVSLGVIAASIWVLAKLPADEIKQGLIGIGAAVLALMILMKSMGKFLDGEDVTTGKLLSLAAIMLSVAAAVGMLVYAVKTLGSMSTADVVQGVIAIIVIIAALVIALKQLDTLDLDGVAMKLIVFAIAVGILAGAVMMLGSLDFWSLIQGVVALAAVMGIMVVAGTKLQGVKLDGIASQIVILSTAFFILASAFLVFDQVSWSGIRKGLVSIAAALVGFVVVSKMLNGVQVAGLATQLLLLASALLVLAVALKVMDTIDASSLADSLIALVLGLGLMVAAVSALPDKAMAEFGLQMILLASSLMVLAVALKMMEKLDPKKLGTSLIVLVLALGAMSLLMNGFKMGVKSALAIVIIAAALGILALSLRLFEGMAIGTIVGGLIALAGALLIFGVASMLFGAHTSGMLTFAAALIVFAAAVVVLARGLEMLANIGFWDSMGAVLAVVLVFGAFIAVAALLAPVIPVLMSLGAALLVCSAAVLVFGLGLFAIAGAFAIFASLSGAMAAVAVGLVLAFTSMAVAIAAMAPILVAALVAVAFAIIQGIYQLLVVAGPVIVGIIWELGVILVAAIGSLVVIIVAGILQLIVSIMDTIAMYSEPLAASFSNMLIQMTQAVEQHLDPMVAAGFSLINEFVGRLAAQIEANAGELGRTLGSSIKSVFKAAIAGQLGFVGGLFGMEEESKIAEQVYLGIEPAINDVDIKTPATSKGAEVGAGLAEGISGEGKDLFNDALGSFEFDIDSLGEGMSMEMLKEKGAEIPGQFSEGMGEGFGDLNSQIPDHVGSMKDTMMGSVESAEIDGIGEMIPDHLSNGILNNLSPIEGASDQMAAKAAEMPNLEAEMGTTGLRAAQGMAAGMDNNHAPVIAAAQRMAKAAKDAADAALDIRSPSREFAKTGKFAAEGLAMGMDDNHAVVKNAGAEMGAVAIEGVNTNLDDAAKAGMTIGDKFAKGLADSPINQRLKMLAVHAKAAHATAVKERKLADMEEKERAEEERKKIYEDVEESRKAIDEARESASEAEKDMSEKSEKSTEKSTKDADKAQKDSVKAAKDAEKKKKAITDAEEKHQKALRERDKYEYRMYGEEAGVAFVDGVAVGLMDDKEPVKTVAEILSELLMGEVKDLKEKTGNVFDVFGGSQTALTATKGLGDNIRDINRAIKRLGTATSSRSITRNIEKIFESIVSFGGGIQNLIGILEIFEPFLPSLLGQFESSLPAIAAMVAPFAPALAASLGGGLAAAVPAILGPAAMIITAIAGIGLFLNDQANDGVILKTIEKMFLGVIDFLVKLPSMIVGALKTLIKGLKNTMKDLPRLIKTVLSGVVNLITGLVSEIPELIPTIIESLLDAILWVILNAPGLVLEIAEALISALGEAITKSFHALGNILTMPFRWLFGQLGGSLDLIGLAREGVRRFAWGFVNTLTSVTNTVLTPFRLLWNMIARIFGLPQLGEDIVLGFRDAVVGTMRKVVDTIAWPFIGLYNLIAGLFGWKKLGYNAASDFIFGVDSGIEKGTPGVVSAADRMAKLMDEHLKYSNKNSLADMSAYIDEYMKLVENGMVNGVEMGSDATRKAADAVWADIESMFDMAGIGKDELEALTNSFYAGTTNPDTIVSSFKKVFERIQFLMSAKGLGTEVVGDLNQSLYDAIKKGMLEESMTELEQKGYLTGKNLGDSLALGMTMSREDIVKASDLVWADIETVFDYYGLGKEGLEELKAAYQEGTRDPAKYSSEFLKVFDAIEEQLQLAGVGTESVDALKTSMVSAIDKVLNPELYDKLEGTKDDVNDIFGPDAGDTIGRGIVGGIFGGIGDAIENGKNFILGLFTGLWNFITAPFRMAFDLGKWIVDKIVSGITGGLDGMKNIGSDLVGGLINGVTGGITKAVDTVKNLGSSIVNGLKNVLGIRSPSRETKKIGAFLMEGLTIGIRQNGSETEEAISDVGEDILNVAKSVIEEVWEVMQREEDFTITPVIDLSNVRQGAKEMAGLVDTSAMAIQTSVDNAQSLAELLNQSSSSDDGPVQNITEIHFEQTNISPEPLSAYEIRQNTERELRLMKMSKE